MDRYDAILEELRKAQSQGLDALATRLDAIVENLGELLQSAKSTVQNSVPTDAEEILPLAEVEALVAELRSETKEPIGGISVENLRTLDAARSQSELLRALLPMLSDHVGRAVVLVIRDGVVSAWSGIGFGDGEKLRGWHGGVAASPNFQRLAETSKPLSVTPAKDPLLSEWLQGDTFPAEGLLLPISLRGKLMGIVYLDHQGDQPWDIEAAQSLNAIACWLIDTLHHRSTVPTPTLAEITTDEAQQDSFTDVEIIPPPPPPEPEPEPEPELEQPTAIPPLEVVVEETPIPTTFEPPDAEPPIVPIPPEPEFDSDKADAVKFDSVSEEDFEEHEVEDDGPSLDYDFEPESPTEPESTDAGFDPTATVRIDSTDSMASPDVLPQPPEIPAPVPAPPSAIPGPEGIDEPSAVELEAPPPVRPVEPPADIAGEAGQAPDEDARQEEARRFARLLVSEIKLYNEDEVERGRAERDLGARLREDIDRSREMYEKRIPEDVRDGHDYFHDELVRILADGDSDALGM